MRPSCILALTGLLAAAATAQVDETLIDRVFARYDRNSDGRVVRAEFPGSDEQFATLDADRDGGVDRAELGTSELARRLTVARRKDAAAPRARAELESIALRRLEGAARFDADRNGRVERTEWRGDPAAFGEIDLDRDGDLDARDREIAARFASPLLQEPELPEFSKRLPGVDELTRALDTDQNGVLSPRELRGHALAEALAWADRNGDGALDVDELRRVERAVAEQIAIRDRGSGRPRAYRVPFDAWDADDDGRLVAAEWAERKYLFARIDQDRDAAVTEAEIARYVRSVEGTTFVERFDLDGDGRVTAAEFGGPPGAFRRADRTGDGTVGRNDR